MTVDGSPVGGDYEAGTTVTLAVLSEGQHRAAVSAVDAAGNESARSQDLLLTIDSTPPALQSAFSRKTHGPAGTFDLALPVAEPWGIECRMAAVTALTLVFGFGEPVYAGAGFAATVTEGTGTPGNAELAGSSLSLGLTGVADRQWLALRLNPIEDPAGNALDLAYTLGILAGDVTLNGTVNAQDILFVRYNSLQPLDQATNFRYDINASGATNAQDVLFVRYCSLHALPPQ